MDLVEDRVSSSTVYSLVDLSHVDLEGFDVFPIFYETRPGREEFDLIRVSNGPWNNFTSKTTNPSRPHPRL